MARTPAADTRLDRRALLRLGGGALALAALGPALRPADAEAGIGWCRMDPVIRVNGRKAHIYVSSTQEMFAQAVAPIFLQVWHPLGASKQLLETDNGFGHGYGIEFLPDPSLRSGTGWVEVNVSLVAPALSSLPVRVEMVPDDPSKPTVARVGAANSWFYMGKSRV
jgi:hypothetical protein